MTVPSRTATLASPARPTSVTIDDLLAAVELLGPEVVRDGVYLYVSHDAEVSSLTVHENERHMSATLDALVEKMGRAGIEPNPEGVSRALVKWLDRRPVSDATAAAKGIATIGWLPGETGARWRVVVPRRSGVCAEWVPTFRTRVEDVRITREHAFARARDLTVTCLPTGDVSVWAYLLNPRLSTAVLAQPDLVAQGQPLEHLYAVFSPERPVAIAHEAAALRLTEESNESHVALPLSTLNNIGWM